MFFSLTFFFCPRLPQSANPHRVAIWQEKPRHFPEPHVYGWGWGLDRLSATHFSDPHAKRDWKVEEGGWGTGSSLRHNGMVFFNGLNLDFISVSMAKCDGQGRRHGTEASRGCFSPENWGFSVAVRNCPYIKRASPRSAAYISEDVLEEVILKNVLKI